MTVIKHKDMDYRSYVRALAESSGKLSDIERLELSGYLLRRDMDTDDRVKIFRNIFEQDNLLLGNLAAYFFTAESPDTALDLHESLKSFAVDYYAKEIEYLMAREQLVIQEEKANQNPSDDYDPNLEDGA